jgi:signal transduction histidine kinase
MTARARPDVDPELDSLGLVHDLRSPVAAAARAFQVLETLLGQPQEATRPFREAVRTSLERAERVVDDWQQLLLPHTVGTETAADEPVALAPLVGAVLRELGLRTTPGGDRITVAPLPTVRGNAAGLRAVLRTVLDNAVRYRRTLVPLRVEIGGTSDGVRAHLWIRDNGRGMPAAERRLVLDPLRRPVASAGGGLGLGLALACRIIDRQGGRITVSSVPGRGTTVRLALPAAT